MAAFLLSCAMPPQGFAQPLSVIGLMPAPGTMVQLSESFVPAILKGMKVYPADPLRFDFLLDTGSSALDSAALQQESTKLIRYFLASLTVPDEDLWVNLSPYENDRIIPDNFGLTEMGRDLLAEDYILKQLTSSLMYPEKALGSAVWKRIYALAFEKYGTTDIPFDTFNKVWIMPDEATVYVNGNNALIASSHLKVMLDTDYLAMKKNTEKPESQGPQAEVRSISEKVIREVVLPEIEKEVNGGRNFSTLRQIFHAMILSTWFKRNMKKTLVGQAYTDRNKVVGIDLAEKGIKDQIWSQYVEAFKKGAFNYIKEEKDESSQELIPRKYFAGGFVDNAAAVKEQEVSGPVISKTAANSTVGDIVVAGVVFNPVQSKTFPMVTQFKDFAESTKKEETIDGSRKNINGKFIGDIWIQAGSYSYKVWQEGGTAHIQRFDKDSKVANGSIHNFKLDQEYQVGKNGRNYAISDETLSAQHFEIRISNGIDGVSSFGLTNIDGARSTTIIWVAQIASVSVKLADKTPVSSGMTNEEKKVQINKIIMDFREHLVLAGLQEYQVETWSFRDLARIAEKGDYDFMSGVTPDFILNKLQDIVKAFEKELIQQKQYADRIEQIRASIQKVLSLMASLAREKWEEDLKAYDAKFQLLKGNGGKVDALGSLAESYTDLLGIVKDDMADQLFVGPEGKMFRVDKIEVNANEPGNFEYELRELDSFRNVIPYAPEKFTPATEDEVNGYFDKILQEQEKMAFENGYINQRTLKNITRYNYKEIFQRVERIKKIADEHNDKYKNFSVEVQTATMFLDHDGKSSYTGEPLTRENITTKADLEQFVAIARAFPGWLKELQEASEDSEFAVVMKKRLNDLMKSYNHWLGIVKKSSEGMFYEQSAEDRLQESRMLNSLKASDWYHQEAGIETSLHSINARDWQAVEDIFSILGKSVKWGNDRQGYFSELENIINKWDSIDGHTKQLIAMFLKIVYGETKVEKHITVLAAEWLRKFFRIYNHVFYLSPESVNSSGKNGLFMLGRVTKVIPVDWRSGEKAVTFVEAIHTNVNGGVKPGTNTQEVLVVENSKVVSKGMDTRLVAVHEAQHLFDVLTLTAGSFEPWELEYTAYLRTILEISRYRLSPESELQNAKLWLVDDIFGGSDIKELYESLGESPEEHVRAMNEFRPQFYNKMLDIEREKHDPRHQEGFSDANWRHKISSADPQAMQEVATAMLNDFYMKKIGHVPQYPDVLKLQAKHAPAPLISSEIRSLHREVSQLGELTDNSMMENLTQDQGKKNDLGGIDLNSNQLKLNETGGKINFNGSIDPAMLEKIEGFSPVVLSIAPMGDPQTFFGSVKN